MDKYLNLAREQKETVKIKVTVITIGVCNLGMFSKGLEKKTGEIENRNHQDLSIVKID